MQVNKAIVGGNAFAHEAGIHQDGMLKERTTYEIMNPQDVGWEGTKLIVGKHSGRAGFNNALQELGIKLDDEQLQAAYLRFLELADRKKHVTAADLDALVTNQLETEDDPIQLVQWKVDIASGEPATAMVVLAHGGQQIVGEAEGNGPVEALLQAIDTATGIEPELEYYNVEAVGPEKMPRGPSICAFASKVTCTPAMALRRTSSRPAREPTLPRLASSSRPTLDRYCWIVDISLDVREDREY